MTFMITWVWMKLTWHLRTMKSSSVLPLTPQDISLDNVESIVFSRNIKQLLRYISFLHFLFASLCDSNDDFVLILIQGGNSVQPAESNDSFMSSKTEPIICYTTKPAHSNISFSGVTGESCAGDFQECGASSSMQLLGDPPWYPQTSQDNNAFSHSVTRNNAVMRYKEKKKARK